MLRAVVKLRPAAATDCSAILLSRCSNIIEQSGTISRPRCPGATQVTGRLGNSVWCTARVEGGGGEGQNRATEAKFWAFLKVVTAAAAATTVAGGPWQAEDGAARHPAPACVVKVLVLRC